MQQPLQVRTARINERRAVSHAGGLSRDQTPRATRGVWLVRLSTLFAICLEVIPIEADVVSVLWSTRAVLFVLVVKLTCLTLILLPLVIYIWLNGPGAIRRVWGRAVIVGVIVVANLAHNISMMSAKV